ncbi:hypothetical protein BASA81_002337 [Batrachochytrium salamandrivorans]|nr:hypothetical protein BASA81_002337 [Batrachochytrium salamandrivorans]
MEPAPQVDSTVGRWTKLEHENFLKGLRDYGKDWKRIGALIQTRTVVQVRTHAQKYFLASSKQRAVSSTSSAASSASSAPKRSSKRNAAATSSDGTPPLSSPAKRKRSDSTCSKTTLVSTDSDSAAVSPMLDASASLKLHFLDHLLLLPPLVDSYSPTSDSAEAASSSNKDDALDEFMLSSVSPLSAEDEEDEAALPPATTTTSISAMAQDEAEALVDDIETLTHASSPVVVVMERETARGANGPGEMENMDAFHIGHLFPKWIEDNDDDLVDDANDVQ